MSDRRQAHTDSSEPNMNVNAQKSYESGDTIAMMQIVVQKELKCILWPLNKYFITFIVKRIHFASKLPCNIRIRAYPLFGGQCGK